MAPYEEYPPNLPFNEYYNVYTPPTSLDYAGGSINAFTSTSDPVSYPFVPTSYATSAQPEAFVAFGPQSQQQPQPPQLIQQQHQQQPPFQFQPQQMGHQRPQPLTDLSLQQPVLDLSNPHHLSVNHISPTESISHSFEAQPPHLSNSPESGASVRSNSPSAAGSPQMNAACVAPGLQASRGPGLVPAFIHHDSYGSDQSQSYESVYDPVAASTEKAGGFVGEFKGFSSSSLLSASQPLPDSLLFPCQLQVQDGCQEHMTKQACANLCTPSVSKEFQKQQSSGDDERSCLFPYSMPQISFSVCPEPFQPGKEAQVSSAERCPPSHTDSSNFSYYQSSDRKEKAFSFTSPLQDISELWAYSDAHTKGHVDSDVTQSISCSSSPDKIHIR